MLVLLTPVYIYICFLFYNESVFKRKGMSSVNLWRGTSYGVEIGVWWPLCVCQGWGRAARVVRVFNLKCLISLKVSPTENLRARSDIPAKHTCSGSNQSELSNLWSTSERVELTAECAPLKTQTYFFKILIAVYRSQLLIRLRSRQIWWCDVIAFWIFATDLSCAQFFGVFCQSCVSMIWNQRKTANDTTQGHPVGGVLLKWLFLFLLPLVLSQFKLNKLAS